MYLKKGCDKYKVSFGEKRLASKIAKYRTLFCIHSKLESKKEEKCGVYQTPNIYKACR